MIPSLGGFAGPSSGKTTAAPSAWPRCRTHATGWSPPAPRPPVQRTRPQRQSVPAISLRQTEPALILGGRQALLPISVHVISTAARTASGRLERLSTSITPFTMAALCLLVGDVIRRGGAQSNAASSSNNEGWSGRRGWNSRPLPWQGSVLILYSGEVKNAL
jgi:hypothetical protein